MPDEQMLRQFVLVCGYDFTSLGKPQGRELNYLRTARTREKSLPRNILM